jgi:23S rRNA (uridine2552-2'-O)-methyltransferase
MTGQGKAKGSGTRGLKTRVKTARGRSTSSTRWLQRQLNDPFVAEARRLGYRSRAAFKLIEIDDKYKLLRPGAAVVDLGAAPGGWSQIAADRIGSTQDKGGKTGKAVAIDILDFEPIAGVDELILDFLDPTAPEKLKEMLGGEADIVLSDMAPNTTGHKQTDHLRIVALVEAALDFACEVLAPGGAFVAKVWSGGTEGELLAAMKRDFETVRHFKPKSSRAESAEVYVVATGFRGNGA